MRGACANESGEGGLGGNREWGLYLGFICYIHHRPCCELWVLESHSCLVTALSGQETGSASSLTEIIAAWANRESH